MNQAAETRMNIHRGLFAAIVGLGLSTAALPAQTTVDLSIYPDNTPVVAGVDITFATESSANVLGIGETSFGGLTNSATGNYPTTEFLNVNFTRSASGLSFFVNAEGGDPTLTYTVFGKNGVALGTYSIGSSVVPVQYVVSQSGVTEVQFSNGLTGSSYEFVLNSLTFSLTPTSVFSTVGLNPNQFAVASNLNNVSTTGNTALQTALSTALAASPNAEAAYLDQLSSQAFGQFTTQTAFNNASFETEAMDNYLAGRRGTDGTFLGGNGNIDASGLTVNDPSYDPALAVIHSRMLAWNPAPAGGVISDVASPVLGGVDMKAATTPGEPAPAASKPWNVAVRGNVILAQGFSGPNVSHFDDNTESVVLSADYRIDPNFLLGLTAGYGHTDVTLDNNGSSATVDSYSPGFYASYAKGGWYANLNGDYVHNAYTQSRVIGFLGQTANSAPEGNEGVANLDGGYDFHYRALTFGPLAGLQYTHLSVDGYNESGSIADLSVNDQDADSLRSRLGARVSCSYSYAGIHLTPHLDASWQHEFLDQSRGISSQFNGAGLGSFNVRTQNPSRDSALVDAGMDAGINETITLFADYEVQAGQDNYFGQSVQAGLKIGF